MKKLLCILALLFSAQHTLHAAAGTGATHSTEPADAELVVIEVSPEETALLIKQNRIFLSEAAPSCLKLLWGAVQGKTRGQIYRDARKAFIDSRIQEQTNLLNCIQVSLNSEVAADTIAAQLSDSFYDLMQACPKLSETEKIFLCTVYIAIKRDNLKRRNTLSIIPRRRYALIALLDIYASTVGQTVRSSQLDRLKKKIANTRVEPRRPSGSSASVVSVAAADGFSG